MQPLPKSGGFTFRPVTSEMRVPVSRHVSQIKRFGSSRRAITRAVWSSSRMRFSRTSGSGSALDTRSYLGPGCTMYRMEADRIDAKLGSEQELNEVAV